MNDYTLRPKNIEKQHGRKIPAVGNCVAFFAGDPCLICVNTNPSFDLFPVRVALSTFKYLLNEALMERVVVVRGGGGGGEGGGGRGMGGEGGLK